MGIQASVKEIATPKEWKSESDWDSHREALYLAVENIHSKPITEFGCGNGSTPLLQKHCTRNDRYFFSYETNSEWAGKFINSTTLMQDYDQVHLSDEPYRQGIIFIDSAPGEQRKELISKHANHAEVLVIHDTERGSQYVYGMAEILSTFKYRLDYEPKGKPHTSIVSNFIEVHKWKDHPSCT